VVVGQTANYPAAASLFASIEHLSRQIVIADENREKVADMLQADILPVAPAGDEDKPGFRGRYLRAFAVSAGVMQQFAFNQYRIQIVHAGTPSSSMSILRSIIALTSLLCVMTNV